MSTTTLPSPLTAAFIGNPNTGKSTIFNALSGMKARVGNFPGVTVEKKIGRVAWDGREVTLVDLPGTYSLSPRTLDEMVSVDVLLGRQDDVGAIDVVVCVVDASNLERNLYLFSQLLDLGLPSILVLNMIDVAETRGTVVDVEGLQRKLDVPVVVTQGHRNIGLEKVRGAVLSAHSDHAVIEHRPFPDEFYAECDRLADKLRECGEQDTPSYLLERLLLDVGGHVENWLTSRFEGKLSQHLADSRERLREAGCRVPVVEARVRYDWARKLLADVVTHPEKRAVTTSDKLDRLLTHRLVGLAFFAALMFVVFQTIYTWAGPLMDACETGQGWLQDVVAASLSPGPLRSLLSDGVIAGVGGVLIFLPQIALLFLFIAILEDCGYMARAAFLMDRLMRSIGLSGKSFVPLMSSFACAVPGVMATRVIENRRDRMITILVAPLMSCSARLPVYLLLIYALFPPTAWLGGWVTLQGLVLFAMYSLGILVAVPVAWFLKKTYFKGETAPFILELPSYKWPSPRIVFHRVYDRAKAFTVRAGTLIFAASILVWAASYFPGDHTQADKLQAEIEALEATAEEDAAFDTMREQQNTLDAELMETSFLGRAGHAIEPAVEPLGWDWKIGVGAIASFPAREVIISTLGTIYSLSGDVDADDEGLQSTIQQATRPDGSKVYNIPVALSIMVFFALCAQCAATLMVIRRETNSWGWPLFAFTYMTVFAYVGALVTYQIGKQFL